MTAFSQRGTRRHCDGGCLHAVSHSMRVGITLPKGGPLILRRHSRSYGTWAIWSPPNNQVKFAILVFRPCRGGTLLTNRTPPWSTMYLRFKVSGWGPALFGRVQSQWFQSESYSDERGERREESEERKLNAECNMCNATQLTAGGRGNYTQVV